MLVQKSADHNFFNGTSLAHGLAMNVEMIAPEFITVGAVQKRIDELERELAASSDASRRHQIGLELQASAFRLYKLNRRRRGLRASTTP
jgi:hypothetical protein